MSWTTDKIAELLAEAEQLKYQADVLWTKAENLEKIAEIMDVLPRDRRCPNTGCHDCPAYVGHPGLCVFSRLKDIINQYHLTRREMAGDQGEQDQGVPA